MLKICQETEGQLLVIQADKRITREDYEKTFIPKMEEMIHRYNDISVLFIFGEDYDGYDPSAMVEDAQYGFKHREHFKKIAVVGAPSWIEAAIRIFIPLLKTELKCFAKEEKEKALEWIKNK